MCAGNQVDGREAATPPSSWSPTTVLSWRLSAQGFWSWTRAALTCTNLVDPAAMTGSDRSAPTHHPSKPDHCQGVSSPAMGLTIRIRCMALGAASTTQTPWQKIKQRVFGLAFSLFSVNQLSAVPAHPFSNSVTLPGYCLCGDCSTHYVAYLSLSHTQVHLSLQHAFEAVCRKHCALRSKPSF